MEKQAEVCIAHEELATILAGLTADLRWLVVLGRWAVGFMGAAFMVLLPFGVYLVNYLVSIDKRLMVIETINTARTEQQHARR